MTPDGKYVLASGKLSPTVSIIDAKTLKVIAEPEVGLGPLHTTFDGRGNAYTSLFVDSPDREVEHRESDQGRGRLHRGPGGCALQCRPYQGRRLGYKLSNGDWLISLNKLSKGMFLPVGPAMPDSQELIDISGDKMRVVAAFPSPPEPHDAVMLKRQGVGKLCYPNLRSRARGGENRGGESGRSGHKVEVDMTCIRSKFAPEQFEVHEGDEVRVKITNVETVRNMTHGFALSKYGINLGIDPGQTVETTFVADKLGTTGTCCTWFVPRFTWKCADACW